MNFSYIIEEKHNFKIISLTGNLIEKNQAQPLLVEIDNLVTQGQNKFIVNLVELKYMNSTGLNVFLSILTKARNAGGEAVITNLSPKIKELLVITKLNAVFTITDDVESAIQKLGNQ